MKKPHMLTPFILVVLLSLLLAACGGGSPSAGGAAEPVAESDSTEMQEEAEVGRAAEGAAASGGEAAPAEPQEEAAEAPDMDMAEDMAVEEEAAEEFIASEGDSAVVAPAEQAAPPLPESTAAPEQLPAAPEQLPAATPAPTQAAEADIAEPLPTPSAEPQTVEVNPFTSTVEDNLSTFAMDVDTASYSAARNYLLNGQMPPASTVRVEEFVNYFDYGYPNVEQGVFGINVAGAPAPFGTLDTQIVRVGIQGQQIDTSQRKDAVLTFVIDVSGSMGDANRLPLVKEALSLLVEQLRPTDQVAIVVYSDDTRAVLEHTSAEYQQTIIDAINSLSIEGSTNVEAGLQLGYQFAARNYQDGAINRVILCSDGVANVGATGPDAILQSVRDYASQGVELTTVGFGMGTFNDYLMEQLANDGNGNYAYVDTLNEAERVFVENLTGTLQVIARDAKIQVEFNPDVVSQYRLLGYENRDVADVDFRNDEVDAGEVGAGHSVTALYEVKLTQQGDGTALTVQIRYEDAETGEVREEQMPLDSSAFAGSFEEAPTNMHLAVAVAGFAEYLRGSAYAQERSLDTILALAEQAEAEFANDSEVQEFVTLVREAQQMR